ncbi:cyclic-di-AMP-binding protein CbpB [Allofustis seminis]|uniref:cyclic-di-AMP-binding protein CbpB n=1 Tax=Allofustis seminis TaxID=166939 RepID=UPI000370E0EC|nr:cyclic-di-AMP-binding protein CbpB [Allofustis seminis]
MISQRMRTMLIGDGKQLIRPASEIAVIEENNKLDHALLLMTNNRYSVVPVLDRDSHIKGLISLPIIIQAIMGMTDIHFEQLGDYYVKEVMNKDFPLVHENYELEDVLQKLVHHAFIPVVNDDGIFQGIITRSEILKGTNHIVHNYEPKYIEPILEILEEDE